MTSQATPALNGIKVIDLTRLLPGAFCSQMLADNGAEVIKVEQPGLGDYNRKFAPLAKEESGSFLLLNRNKKSITLNLKALEGKDLFQALVAKADVVLEGFRPGVMERLGLSYDRLAEINPGLVYCSITGFGQTGPYRDVAAHDINYLGMTGVLQLSTRRGERPSVPGISIADVGGGSLMAAYGVLTALMARSHSGKGQFVDVSMVDGLVAWLCYHAADYLFAGIEPRGAERPFLGQCACYNTYRCRGGQYLTLGIIEEQFWMRFCELIERPDLVRSQWPEGEEAEAQYIEVAAIIACKTRDEWVKILHESDIPVGPVNSFQELFADPHIAARELLLCVDHPREGQIPQLGFPIKFSGTPCAIKSPPPLLGEHTDEILGDLGIEPKQIKILRDKGVI